MSGINDPLSSAVRKRMHGHLAHTVAHADLAGTPPQARNALSSRCEPLAEVCSWRPGAT